MPSVAKKETTSSTARETSTIADMPGAVDNLGFWYVFPTVHGKAGNGRKTLWTIMVGLHDIIKNKPTRLTPDLFKGAEVSDEDYYGIIRIDFSYEGGKVRDDPYTYVKRGKNLGRANETNPFTQALKEAHAKYIKATDRDGETDYVRPMLARDIKKVHDISWPVYVQCKYNGNRAMFMLDGKRLIPYSRNLKPVTVSDRVINGILRVYSAARKAFDKLTEDEMKDMDLINEHGRVSRPDRARLFLDGELYAHGKSLQTLGRLRSKVAVEDKATKYYLFDVYLSSFPNMVYQDRYKLIKKIRDEYGGDDDEVVFVKTYMAASLNEANAYKEKFVAQGYEGAMIRQPNTPYEQSNKGYHSKNLIKLKPRYEEEYEVIGFSGGESSGKEEGALLIIVDVGGTDLTLQPALPLDERKGLFERYTASPRAFREELNGKMIKVYFDEKSDDGIPLRAKTKLEVRDEE